MVGRVTRRNRSTIPGYTDCMRNDVEPVSVTATKPLPAQPPLVILATDEDAMCVDDLCLPARLRDAGVARETRDEPEPAG